MTDLAIVGSGISALTAAIYAAREGLSVCIFQKEMIGGIITTSENVENYPGFEAGISGIGLMKKVRAQAEKFGARIEYGEVSDIRAESDRVLMKVDGADFEARTLLLAVGNSYRRLGLAREDEFFGRGIHVCATCDGAIYAGKEVVAVGGGDNAVQEALFLAQFAKVKLLVRSQLRAQQILQDRLSEAVKAGKIEVLLGAEIEEILFGQSDLGEKIRGVKVRQMEHGEPRKFEISADAIFEFIGFDPQTQFLAGSGVELNPKGEIVVNNNLQTSVDRIFACGDAVENAEHQLVIAAGSGAKAAIEISKSLHQ